MLPLTQTSPRPKRSSSHTRSSSRSSRGWMAILAPSAQQSGSIPTASPWPMRSPKRSRSSLDELVHSPDALQQAAKVLPRVTCGPHRWDVDEAGGGALGGPPDALEKRDEAEAGDGQLAVGDVDSPEVDEERRVVVEGGLDGESLFGGLNAPLATAKAGGEGVHLVEVDARRLPGRAVDASSSRATGLPSRRYPLRPSAANGKNRRVNGHRAALHV